MLKLPQNLPNFQDAFLLQRALTHRSYVNENPEAEKHNERLEFLGDAILNFLSGEFLYKKYPEKSEGELTELRSTLVDAKQLAEFAIALDLGSKLRLGRGAEREGGRHNLRILSSTFEAVIGAYFLDGNSDIDKVRKYLLPFFKGALHSLALHSLEDLQLENTRNYGLVQMNPSSVREELAWDPADLKPTINYKSRFQKWALAQGRDNPTYVTVAESGPDHAKEFVVEVRVDSKTYGRGMGRKKQEAEKEAARDALERLKLI